MPLRCIVFEASSVECRVSPVYFLAAAAGGGAFGLNSLTGGADGVGAGAAAFRLFDPAAPPDPPDAGGADGVGVFGF